MSVINYKVQAARKVQRTNESYAAVRHARAQIAARERETENEARAIWGALLCAAVAFGAAFVVLSAILI